MSIFQPQYYRINYLDIKFQTYLPCLMDAESINNNWQGRNLWTRLLWIFLALLVLKMLTILAVAILVGGPLIAVSGVALAATISAIASLLAPLGLVGDPAECGGRTRCRSSSGQCCGFLINVSGAGVRFICPESCWLYFYPSK